MKVGKCKIDMGVFEKAGWLLWWGWSTALERLIHGNAGKKKMLPFMSPVEERKH